MTTNVSAANPTKAMKEEWNRETKANYGLTAEQLAEVDAQLEEIAASRALTAGPSNARVPLADLMGEPSLAPGLPDVACFASSGASLLAFSYSGVQQFQLGLC